MATFTGTAGIDTADAVTGTLTGFTGGTIAELQDAIGDTFEGMAGLDTVVAGGGDDVIVSSGVDNNISGQAGNDRFVYELTGVTLSVQDSIDGGSDTDTIEVRGTGGLQLRLASIASIEQLEFQTVAGESGMRTVVFQGGQIAAGNVSPTLHVIGAPGTTTDKIAVETSYQATNIDLSGWTFQDWGDPAEFVSIYTDSGAYDDIVVPPSVESQIYTNAGNDTIFLGPAQIVAQAGFGNDVFVITPSSSASYLSGGSGTDTIELRGAGTFDLVVPSGSVDFTLLSIEELVFETVVGESGVRTLRLEGLHVATGAMLNATLAITGAAGTTTDRIEVSLLEYVAVDLSGWTFQDWGEAGEFITIVGDDDDETITGTSTDDLVRAGAGTDILDGGGGIDTLQYWDSPAGVTVHLFNGFTSGGDAQGDTIANFENVQGSDFVDDLRGDDNANRIDALAGNDMINGLGGNDTLLGGAGNDTIEGGSGSDTLLGEAGDDLLDGGADADEFDGGPDTDTVTYVDSPTGVDIDLGAETSFGGDAEGDKFTSIENLTGSVFADTLTGDTGPNVLSGLEGDDALNGGSGDDDLFGGPGDDLLRGGPGQDRLDGQADIDTASYLGSPAAVQIDLAMETATGGDATGDSFYSIENLIGSDHDDTLTGDAGDNALFGEGGGDTINGGDGDDLIEGGGGADTLTGGANGTGGDTLSYAGSSAGVTINLAVNTASGGDASGDTISGFENLLGSAFDDTLSGNAVANRIDGGEGIDWALFTDSPAGVIVHLGTGTGSGAGSHALGDTYANIENVAGSGFDDVITGDDAENELAGADGNDILRGGDGVDTLTGGLGNDRLDGGPGVDTMSGEQGDDIYIVADAGDLVVESAGQGFDTVYAYLSYTLAAEVEVLVLRGAATDGVGNSGPNRIYGNGNVNLLAGDNGADLLIAGPGEDVLQGGNGDDRLDGGPGADTMEGGRNSDIYIVDNPGDMVVELALQGTDSIYTYVDFTASAYVENLILRGGARVGTGNAEANSIAGTTGNDTLTGLAGNDKLFGKAGNDTLDGGADNDRLYGDRGQDTQTGGTGQDQFFFRETLDSSNQVAFADVITDFTQAEFDKINLTAIDADETNGAGTNEAFSFIGNASAFTAPGQIRFEQVGGDTHVFGNTDADLFPEFAIVLTGTITLTSGDFIL